MVVASYSCLSCRLILMISLTLPVVYSHVLLSAWVMACLQELLGVRLTQLISHYKLIMLCWSLRLKPCSDTNSKSLSKPFCWHSFPMSVCGLPVFFGFCYSRWMLSVWPGLISVFVLLFSVLSLSHPHVSIYSTFIYVFHVLNGRGHLPELRLCLLFLSFCKF